MRKENRAYRRRSELFRSALTLNVLLQSCGLDRKAAGLASLGRCCSRHHAGYFMIFGKVSTFASDTHCVTAAV